MYNMTNGNPFTAVLRRNRGGIGDIGKISEGDRPLLYVPDLAPVGSGAAYFPRSVDDDAVALNVLGFQAGFPGGGVSQSSDMARTEGAWDPTFRGAVTAFQQRNPLSGKADGWIGPNTRRALAAAVAVFNATPRSPGALPLPVIPPGIPAPGGPIAPAPGKALPAQPASNVTADDDDTLMYVGIGVGALALLGLGYYAFTR